MFFNGLDTIFFGVSKNYIKLTNFLMISITLPNSQGYTKSNKTKFVIVTIFYVLNDRW